MKKETFVRVINAIDAQYSRDKEHAKKLEEIFPDSTIMPSYSEELIGAIVDALKVEMCDSDWIDYYMYELDFGRKNKQLKAYDENGVEMPLSTPEDLYDLLENNKSKIELIAVEFEDDNGVTHRIEHDDDTSLEC